MDTTFTVNGKTVRAALTLPPAGKGPGILLLHAWWGLKPFFVELCSRLAEQGFVVFAPDLNNGEIAKTVDEAADLMKRRDYEFMGETIMTARDFLLAHPACTSQKIGLIGFSMGAAWALVVAARSPGQVAATVLFYGSGDEDFSKLQAPVLGHFSDVDEWEPLADVQAMEKKMRASGVDVTFHFYPGQSHWFMEEDRPEFSPQAAALAWQRTFDFLRANLT